jgi:replicative DNA helicase
MQSLPHSLEAEQAVLAAVVLDNRALVVAVDELTTEDFYLTKHQTMFSAMTEMFRSHVPVDMITLTDHLQKSGKLESAGGIGEVSGLAGKISTAANIRHWTEIVKERAKERRLVSEARVVWEICSSGQEGALEEAQGHISIMAQVLCRGSEKGVATWAESVDSLISEKEEQHRRRIAARNGEIVPPSRLFYFGYPKLDRQILGIRPGWSVLIPGVTKNGKTILALQLFQHNVLDLGYKGLYFSLEMSHTELASRIISMRRGISNDRLTPGNLSQDDWKSLGEEQALSRRVSAMIDDRAGMTWQNVVARSAQVKAKQGLDLVVIDYVQRLEPSSFRQSREECLTDASRAFKNMARELDVAVVVVAQIDINKVTGRKGNDQKTRLGDVRDCKNLENDCDLEVAPFIRSKMSLPGPEEEAEIGIVVFRHGPSPYWINMKFESAFTRFVEPSQDDLFGGEKR